MRIRNAAIAGATALAVAFGGTTVASATPDVDASGNVTVSEDKHDGGTLSSKIGSKLDATQPADGEAIFGSSKDLSSQPAWAKVLYSLTILGGIGSILGGIIGPVYNFLNHGPSF